MNLHEAIDAFRAINEGIRKQERRWKAAVARGDETAAKLALTKFKGGARSGIGRVLTDPDVHFAGRSQHERQRGQKKERGSYKGTEGGDAQGSAQVAKSLSRLRSREALPARLRTYKSAEGRSGEKMVFGQWRKVESVSEAIAAFRALDEAKQSVDVAQLVYDETGKVLPGFKLVNGKIRRWSMADEVLATSKARLREIPKWQKGDPRPGR